MPQEQEQEQEPMRWIVRTTVDESGDYPFPTYDILELHDYGPQSVACAYQNPKYARLMAAAPRMRAMLEKVLLNTSVRIPAKDGRDGCVGCVDDGMVAEIRGILEETKLR